MTVEEDPKLLGVLAPDPSIRSLCRLHNTPEAEDCSLRKGYMNLLSRQRRGGSTRRVQRAVVSRSSGHPQNLLQDQIGQRPRFGAGKPVITSDAESSVPSSRLLGNWDPGLAGETSANGPDRLSRYRWASSFLLGRTEPARSRSHLL